MPNAALRPCSYPGCVNLVKAGRCELHRVDARAFPARQRMYDRAWQRRRRLWLGLHPWCEKCLAAGFYVPATEVHHLTPHRGDREIFLTSPLESLCKPCHSQETLKEQREGA